MLREHHGDVFEYEAEGLELDGLIYSHCGDWAAAVRSDSRWLSCTDLVCATSTENKPTAFLFRIISGSRSYLK